MCSCPGDSGELGRAPRKVDVCHPKVAELCDGFLVVLRQDLANGGGKDDGKDLQCVGPGKSPGEVRDRDHAVDSESHIQQQEQDVFPFGHSGFLAIMPHHHQSLDNCHQAQVYGSAQLADEGKIQGIQSVYQYGADENMEFLSELGLDQGNDRADKSAYLAS